MTGKVWHSDEMMMKVKGDYNWQWNVIDRDSRFLIASQITKERYIDDAKNLLEKAKNQVNNKPQYLFTDGLQSYNKATEKQLKGTQHIRCPSITSKRQNNNIVERYHNTLRERDRMIRGYKKQETAQQLVDGFQDYYNYIRTHQALGTTPAQKAGVSLRLEGNRWLGLLKQSVRC